MKKLMCLLLLMTSTIIATEKFYVDSADLCTEHETFRIHTGGNLWIETNTMHRDTTGLYTFETDILRNAKAAGYEKKWKCPYCHRYWKVGERCKNDECPRHYTNF